MPLVSMAPSASAMAPVVVALGPNTMTLEASKTYAATAIPPNQISSATSTPRNGKSDLRRGSVVVGMFEKRALAFDVADQRGDGGNIGIQAETAPSGSGLNGK